MPENRQTLAATPKASLEEESTLRCGPGSGNYSDGTIIRYNISQDDVNQIIQFSGAATNTQIYNNTIYIGLGLSPIISGAHLWGGTGNWAPFVADIDFSGGTTIDHANTIDLSKVTDQVPMDVYQTARIDNFTYTISGFTAGSSHTVRLQFAETYFDTTGSRTFNVTIDDTQVLTDFDIVKAAGGKNTANIQQFAVNANSSGQFVITFNSVVNNSLIGGIEID
jgi:Malectin domain